MPVTGNMRNHRRAEQVHGMLAAARDKTPGGASTAPDPARYEREIIIGDGNVELAAHLLIPDAATRAVIFAHSGSASRRSPEYRFAAAALEQAGLGVFLVGLLTPEEELSRGNVYNVRLLAGRLTSITRFLLRHPAARELPVGYFGVGTGAAAALWAAAADPRVPVGAIVCQAGRPDLAGPQLGFVRSPTLLIVGGGDEAVLGLNRQARRELRCESELAIVPAGTDLSREPGALEQAAGLAVGWFIRHPRPAAAPTHPR